LQHSLQLEVADQSNAVELIVGRTDALARFAAGTAFYAFVTPCLPTDILSETVRKISRRINITCTLPAGELGTAPNFKPYAILLPCRRQSKSEQGRARCEQKIRERETLWSATRKSYRADGLLFQTRTSLLLPAYRSPAWRYADPARSGSRIPAYPHLPRSGPRNQL
jgi:hypothetical protein